MFASAWSLAGGITPDGGTVTTAATGANGRITVGVAQAMGGVSTNTYRDFNVPRAGVDLDNNAALARTILNQVTSTNPSILEGPLSVLGPRANVILSLAGTMRYSRKIPQREYRVLPYRSLFRRATAFALSHCGVL
ncbi:hypothetical protein UB46_28285 [Burkholderiaceae bacterium 16]|nr:hypothetical protein UB46_28285 [Burkholderiaceae bacterium 16]